jgi:transcriptional regulator with XRE-family HTH domain
MTGRELKAKRSAAGISGAVLSSKVRMSRSRLSEIERAYISPSPEEFERLKTALDALIQAKIVINQAAIAAGWPGAEVA